MPRAVCSRKQRWNGVPPLAGPSGRRRFFCRFSAHFCVTLEHLFLKRQNVEEKSAQKSAHQKSAHQKSAQKSAHQKSAQKWATRSAQISAHQKSAQKSAHQHSVFWNMEARRKRQKNLRQICAKPQPQGASPIVDPSSPFLFKDRRPNSGVSWPSRSGDIGVSCLHDSGFGTKRSDGRSLRLGGWKNTRPAGVEPVESAYLTSNHSTHFKRL